MGKQKNKKELTLEEQYRQIMTTPYTTPLKRGEWSKPGDNFKKFTLYKEYTPVKTSNSTEITTKL